MKLSNAPTSTCRESGISLQENVGVETSRSEIMALLGLLYLIGIRKGHHTNVRELWTADGTGVQILRACMSYDYFLFLRGLGKYEL